MNKLTELDSLKSYIETEQICSELAAEATQLVFGEGSNNAEIVFIGEAPGKKEDLQGKPFVGASGRLLDEMLESIGLKREDVYITNIVKYRPPNNRDPLPAEKQAFLPILQAQLGIIQPKVVVTLGRHSMNCFLPDLQISKVHGEPQSVTLRFGNTKIEDGIWRQLDSASSHLPDSTFQMVILPLYHPAAALYNGGMRQTLFEDFSQIPQLLKKL